jgi:hypothetical protein
VAVLFKIRFSCFRLMLLIVCNMHFILHFYTNELGIVFTADRPFCTVEKCLEHMLSVCLSWQPVTTMKRVV